MRIKYEKPKQLYFWMLLRTDGSWVGAHDSDGYSPFAYDTRREAMEAGWNFPTNPCRAVRVKIEVMR